MTSAASSAAEQRRSRAASARTLIIVGTLITVFGIALAVTEEGGFGGWFTLAGLVASIAALHRYGRLGSDGKRDRIASSN